MLGRSILAASLLAIAPISGVGAQQDPTSATVFLSVAGRVTAARVLDERTSAPELELRDVELQTGSGFFFCSLGYVLTNLHVLEGGKHRVTARGIPYEIALEAQKTTVIVPAADPGEPARSFDASVVASDADLDLAVLFVGGADRSYVPFGDSDALRSGGQVSVLGYPLGRLLEVGRPSSREPPSATVSTGIVSALRPDDRGTLRFVQTSAPVSPGSSGGPMLNRHGFAVGVVNLRATGGSAVAFAIPINVVKDFLARHGLDSLLPATRLAPGAAYEAPGKLVSLQVPIGFHDTAPSRTRIDSGDSLGRVLLHLDRVASPWRAERIIEELMAGRALNAMPARTLQEPERPRDGARGLLVGLAEGERDGAPQWILFGVLDLGEEKIVARYVGAADEIAFNESVLRASLASLEATRMLDPSARPTTRLAVLPTPIPSAPIASIPAEWTVDESGPFACEALPVAVSTLGTSPAGDFTVSFRAARWTGGIDPAKAAASCAGRSGSVEGTTYAYRFSWLGIDYSVEGLFRRADAGMLQFEMIAPTPKASSLRPLFSAWAPSGGPR